MAKIKTSNTSFPPNSRENILKMSINSLISDRFGRYSKYIIQDRAIPDARDGLKPVQRRILFAMDQLKLKHDTAYKKSARVVGEVIGKYHPHGDSSIYDAMVRMSQSWKMNVPLVQMHGNNGSMDADPAAAMRYTEVRLSQVAERMMDNIHDQTVSFAPNFDDSEVEPTVLPGVIPNLLINGTSGIAAGYATEMPPHNPNEIFDAIVYLIKNPDAKNSELLSIVKGPDFPTGGIVEYNRDLKSCLETGRGRVIIRSRYTIEKNAEKDIHQIIISEIPFGVIKSKLVKEIDDIAFNKQINGIKEARDESDKSGVRVVIELNQNANSELIIKYLLAKTEMQIYYNYNNICIYKNTPSLMNLSRLIQVYIEHRREIITKYKQYELAKNKRRLEIVQGLIKVGKIYKDVIQTIQESVGSRQGVILNLQQVHGFTQLQAEAIADLKLYRLSHTDQSEYEKEAAELSKSIEEAIILLNNKSVLDNFLAKQVEALKTEFFQERRTQITKNTIDLKLDEKSYILDEPTNITVTNFGYVKRLSDRTLETNDIETFEVKEDDILIHFAKTTTKNSTLVFTTSGSFILIPNYKFVEDKWKSPGIHLNSLTTMPENTRIVSVMDVEQLDIPLYVCMVSKQGKVTRIPLTDFESTRYSRPIGAMRIKEGDSLVDAQLSIGEQNIVVITKFGKVTKYPESRIPATGLKSVGIFGVKLAKNDEVTAFAIANDNETVGVTFFGGYFAKLDVSTIKEDSFSRIGESIFTNLPLDKGRYVQRARVVEHQSSLIFSGSQTRYIQMDESLKYFASGKIQQVDDPSAVRSSVLTLQLASIRNKYLSTNKSPNEHKLQDEEMEQFNENSNEFVSNKVETKYTGTHDKQFKEVEEKIKKASQLSFDDILKKDK